MNLRRPKRKDNPVDIEFDAKRAKLKAKAKEKDERQWISPAMKREWANRIVVKFAPRSREVVECQVRCDYCFVQNTVIYRNSCDGLGIRDFCFRVRAIRGNWETKTNLWWNNPVDNGMEPSSKATRRMDTITCRNCRTPYDSNAIIIAEGKKIRTIYLDVAFKFK